MKNFILTLTTNAEFEKQKQRLLSENPNKKFYVNIGEKPKKRSVPANNAYYAWLEPISDMMGVLLPEARCYLKLTFGLPILFSGEMHEKANDLYQSLTRCGFFGWNYETQMHEMKVRDVTSIMNTKQHSQMREQIQVHFSMQGLNLEYNK